MDRTPDEPARVAMKLVSVLNEMTVALERAVATSEDQAWLRPLLVLQAEIEFTARRAGPALATLADECRELTELLDQANTDRGEFRRHYAPLRATSNHLELLHEQALAACGRLLRAARSRRLPLLRGGRMCAAGA